VILRISPSNGASFCSFLFSPTSFQLRS
jgi:hypothetical protein